MRLYLVDLTNSLKYVMISQESEEYESFVASFLFLAALYDVSLVHFGDVNGQEILYSPDATRHDAGQAQDTVG